MDCFSKPQDKTNRRQFVKLSSLSHGASTVSIGNSLPVVPDNLTKGFEPNSEGEEQLIVDEVNSATPAALGRGTSKNRTPALKLKLSGLFDCYYLILSGA